MLCDTVVRELAVRIFQIIGCSNHRYNTRTFKDVHRRFWVAIDKFALALVGDGRELNTTALMFDY